jgi:hypothetical protein
MRHSPYRRGTDPRCLALVALLPSCILIDDFDFEEADGPPDAAVPGEGNDGCTPSPEVCNGVDDDCDGTTDEDPTECAFENASTACGPGGCGIGACQEGFLDCDPVVGCEAREDSPLTCNGCGERCPADERCTEDGCSTLDYAWLAAVDSTVAGAQEVVDVAVDDSGAVYLAGAFEGEVRVTDSRGIQGPQRTAAGANDVFVASVTSTGFHRFTRSFGSEDRESEVRFGGNGAGDLVVGFTASDDVVVGGTTLFVLGSPDTFLILLGPSGVVEGTIQISATGAAEIRGTRAPELWAVGRLPGGDVVALVNAFDDLSAAGLDIERPEDANILYLRFSAENGSVLVGDWITWLDTVIGAEVMPSGRAYVYGSTEGAGARLPDLTNDDFQGVLARFDADGTYGRATVITAIESSFTGVVEAPDGTVYATFFGDDFATAAPPLDEVQEDLIVVALSPELELRWFRPIGEVLGDTRGKLAVAPDGTLLVSARFSAIGDLDVGRGTLPAPGSGFDWWMAGFAPDDGELLWATVAGGSANDLPGGLTAGGRGQVVGAINHLGTLTFGGETFLASDADALIFQLDR